MMNYGIFTQIFVLQGFNEKEEKRVGKSNKKWLKQENGKYRHIIYNVMTKPQGHLQKFVVIRRTMSQQRPSRVQDDSRKIVATFHNYVTTQYEKKYKKMLQHINECHNTMEV